MITSPASASQQHAKLSMWVANAKREPGGAVAELFFWFQDAVGAALGFPAGVLEAPLQSHAGWSSAVFDSLK